MLTLVKTIRMTLLSTVAVGMETTAMASFKSVERLNSPLNTTRKSRNLKLKHRLRRLVDGKLIRGNIKNKRNFWLN